MDEALLEEIRLTLRQAVDALTEAGHIPVSYTHLTLPTKA